MNKLPAIIKQVQKSGSILLVDSEVNGFCFSSFLIETNEQPDWLQTNKNIFVIFKETEVSIAKDLTGKISTRNRMKCKVLKIEKGELLSRISLQFQEFTIFSAITTRAVEYLVLKEDDEVEALVKSNEISLSVMSYEL